MEDKTLGFLISLTEQLKEVWQKLGGKYAEWDDEHVHNILFQKHITKEAKYEFELYTKAERMAAIGVLKNVLSAYQRQWRNTWEVEHNERERRKTIFATCLTLIDAVAWIKEHAPNRFVPELFEYVDSINGVDYYRKREPPLELWSPWRAKDFHAARCTDDTKEFPEPFFKPVTYPGHNGLLFQPLFILEASA